MILVCHVTYVARQEAGSAAPILRGLGGLGQIETALSRTGDRPGDTLNIRLSGFVPTLGKEKAPAANAEARYHFAELSRECVHEHP